MAEYMIDVDPQEQLTKRDDKACKYDRPKGLVGLQKETGAI